MVSALGTVLVATANAEVTPEEAVSIATVLEVKRKAIETVDLDARLAALEKEIEP